MMFKIAGVASFVTLPLIWLYLSESVEFYLKKQPPKALDKVNAIFQKMGKPTVDRLPAIEPKQVGIPVRSLLSGKYLTSTLQLWLALFLAFGCLYFLTSWIPKLASNAGLPMALAIYAGTVFNAGAFIGILTQGYFSTRFGLKRTIGMFFIATAVLMAIFKFFIGSDGAPWRIRTPGIRYPGGLCGLICCSSPDVSDGVSNHGCRLVHWGWQARRCDRTCGWWNISRNGTDNGNQLPDFCRADPIGGNCDYANFLRRYFLIIKLKILTI